MNPKFSQTRKRVENITSDIVDTNPRTEFHRDGVFEKSDFVRPIDNCLGLRST